MAQGPGTGPHSAHAETTLRRCNPLALIVRIIPPDKLPDSRHIRWTSLTRCENLLPMNRPTAPIFVFGSNLAGRHGKGAALHARQNCGAIYGVGVGRTGDAYAIPTKDKNLNTLPLPIIRQHVATFIAYARTNPELRFQITPIGTGLAGYKHTDIAPMFTDVPPNCSVPDEWRQLSFLKPSPQIPKDQPIKPSLPLPTNAPTPRVLNKHHGNIPKDAVYIGRPSTWGNPFVIGKDGDRAEVIAKYRDWLSNNTVLMAALPDLRGRDLVCFCAPAPCHGDVLLEMANGKLPEQQAVPVPPHLRDRER